MSKSHLYYATISNNPNWPVKFHSGGVVKSEYHAIKQGMQRIFDRTGGKLVHIWVYDEPLGERWVAGYLTERQLKAHFGIEIPNRFLRGESSPAMTDFLNDRGRED